MKINQLLAKSTGTSDDVFFSSTLEGHTLQVLDVVNLILELTGKKSFIAFGCNIENYSLFEKTLRMAAVLHDFGKASSEFTTMLHRKGNYSQAVRHEVISDWFLQNHKGIRQVTEQFLEKADWAILALRVSILGHHLKFPYINDTNQFGNLQTYFHLPCAETLLRLVEQTVGQSFDWDAPLPVFSLWTEDVRSYLSNVRRELKRLESGLTAEEKVMIRLVRGLLIAADSLGSTKAMTKQNWTQEKLKDVCAVLSPGSLSVVLDELIRNYLQGKEENKEITEFQDNVKQSSCFDITIVEAGCGSGKTVAAYRWGQSVERPYLCFAYPTTATATQGYIEYLGKLGESGKKLHHSRNKVDLELLANQEQESEDIEDQKYRALEHMLQPVTICTVDTIVGMMQLYYSSLCVLPQIARSAIVFDEVHSYPDKLFRNLIEFVKVTKVPMLIMSASLQPERRLALEQLAAELNEDGRSVNWCHGPAFHQAIPRYRLHVKEEMPLDLICSAIEQGRNVLVVINTVGRSVEIYDRIQAECKMRRIPAAIFCYHSHFKYADRVKRQEEIIKHFRSGHSVCAITTQIAEMSFDVSCDLLVSEIAPLSSIVQRLGRLNRYAKQGDLPKHAYFWMPNHEKPYDWEELNDARNLLVGMENQNISQQDLADVLGSSHQKSRELKELEIAWDMLSRIPKNSVREPMLSIEAMLESDYEMLRRKGTILPQRILRYVFSIGINTRLNQFRKWRYVYLIPDSMIKYDSEKGVRWKNE